MCDGVRARVCVCVDGHICSFQIAFALYYLMVNTYFERNLEENLPIMCMCVVYVCLFGNGNALTITSIINPNTQALHLLCVLCYCV